MGRIFDVINKATAKKNTLNEGHVFAVQGVLVDGI